MLIISLLNLFMSQNISYNQIVSFIFEAGLLNRFKRSGFDFLGTGNQNISSHSFRTAVISYILAEKLNADSSKAVLLSLFHDIPETRTGDINHFQKKYVEKNEMKAVEDIAEDIKELSSLPSFISEFNNGSSIEAEIARDADILELIFTLKEEVDNGNKQAEIWLKGALKRLKLDESIKIAETALSVKSYDWWHDILKVNR